MKKLFLLCCSILLLGFSGSAQDSFFTDNFNAGTIGTGWKGDGAYGLKQAAGILQVKVSSIKKETFFTLDLGKIANITTNPFVNIKLKGDKPYILKVFLVDASGATTSQDVRVPVSGIDFVNYCLDFSAAGAVDKTKITKINISVNYEVNGYSGTIYFEDLFVGTSASKFANLSGVSDVLIAENATAQKILVTDIKNASAITLSGGAAIIQNVVISTITNGMCSITYDAKAAGTDAITLTAVGNVGFSNNTNSFTLTTEGNIAPTFDQPADAKITNGKITKIQLTGITDGNMSLEQPLTITATSGTAATIPNPVVTYTLGSPYATLTVDPAAAGSSIITVTVKDDGALNHSTEKTFNITSYNNFNYAPTINIPANQGIYKDEVLNLKLTGISDGDGGTQTLNVAAAAKSGKVTVTPLVYVNGQDNVTLTLTGSNLGKDTITVTATDNGGGSSNGPQITKVSFIVEVLAPAPEGYKVPMVDFTVDTTAGLWEIEGLGVTQHAAYIDTLGSRCIRLQISGKSNWAGLWYNLNKVPMELNVTKYPYMSFEILAKGFRPVMTHAYFWAVAADGSLNRNATGAHLQRDTIINDSTAFQKVFLDYRMPGMLNAEDGNPINTNRVVRILFNYHDKFLWPNNLVSGTVYIKDIRLGDSCKNVSAVVPACVINNIPTQVYWAAAGKGTIQLSGISNGKNLTGVILTSLSLKKPFIPDPIVGTINPDGTATLTYDILNANVDSSKIVVNVTCPGSLDKQISFLIKTASINPVDAISVNVDGKIKGQTIVGFGCANQLSDNQLIAYAQDQGCTFMRLFGLTQFELKNDNGSNLVLDRSKLNYSDLDLDFIRKASAAGVTDFFVTLLSPPAWMLLSLSCAGVEGAPAWGTTLQKVDPIYYDEYVEYMVAITRVIKEETGVELAGFCPQNEPAFIEPYPGAILDPIHMATVCGMLGKRLAAEGFKTKVINSEQVFHQGYNPVLAYINALKADPDGNQYTSVVGMHYPNANAGMWSQQYTACKTGTYPKELWATECITAGNDYETIMNESEFLVVGLNNGLSAWAGLGYNGSSSGDENSVIIKGGMMAANNKLKHFYAYKNFAKFIRKGAVQLKTTSGNSNVVAASFQHPTDNTMTIVLINKDRKLPYTIRLTGSAPATGWEAYRTSFFEKCEKVDAFKNGMVVLPPRSITTLTIKTNVNHAPTADPAADIEMTFGAGGSSALISGIGCGDPSDQSLTVTATSSDPSLFSPVVNYSTPANKATILLMAPEKEGVANIQVIIKDDGGRLNGGIDADTLNFKVSVKPSSLKDASSKISVYPNPASDVVSLSVPAELSNSKLSISNITGQVVLNKNLEGETQVELSIAELPAGTYIISISDNKTSAKTRFVKK